MAQLPSPDPGTPDLLHQAMALHQQGRRSEADPLYARFLQAEPRHAQALRLIGILARESGEPDRSIRLLKQAIDAAPDNAEPLNELALSYMIAGELQLADVALRQALTIDPASLKALTNHGALLQFRGHIDAAIALHRQALEVDPADPEVRCNLAKALIDAGRNDEALDETDRVVALSGRHPLALAARGAVLCDLERFEDAEAVLAEAIAGNPGDDTVLVNLGFAQRKLDRFDAATETLRQAVTVNRENARAVADFANLLSGSGLSDDALELCERFLANHPGERLVVAVYAYALRDAGREDEAGVLLDFGNLIRITDIGAPELFDSLEQFNAALTQLIIEHPSLLASPVSKSTRGGMQTGELDPDGYPALAALATLIEQAAVATVNDFEAAGLADHPVMANASEAQVLRAWGTVLEQDGQQLAHMHPLGWLSGVYYSRVPDDMAPTASQAGWIEFGAPPERYLVHAPPAVHAIEPREGRLVLFPSWFYHRTRPFLSNAARVSIGFDLVPKSALRLF